MKNILTLCLFAVATIVTIPPISYSGEISFTQEDRDRYIRLETLIETGFHQIDKRFEQVDKRFEELREDMNKRFELMDKRFEQVDKRFEQVDKRFEQVDKRFEQMDKRFEHGFAQVDKRFEQMMAFLGILTGIFTTLTLGVIGFAYWDRRTIIRKAKEETVAEIEKEGRLRDLINALREVSKGNGELAKVLRQFHIL